MHMISTLKGHIADLMDQGCKVLKKHNTNLGTSFDFSFEKFMFKQQNLLIEG